MNDIRLTAQELEDVKDQIRFREKLYIEIKYLRRDMDGLLAQPDLCRAAWRKDILWFCGTLVTLFGILITVVIQL